MTNYDDLIDDWFGTQFVHLRSRRNGTEMFVDIDWDNYIRIGKTNDIINEYELHKRLLDEGVRVSNISKLFQDGDISAYSESSIGKNPIALMTKLSGVGRIVSDENFNSIYENAKSLISYQYNNEIIVSNHDYLIGTEAYRFLEEFKNKRSYSKLIKYTEDFISNTEKLSPNFLTAFVHWDFNAFNHMEDWIIDFEDSYIWNPLVDWISLMFHNMMFNFTIGTRPAYVFTPEQLNALLSLYSGSFWTDFDWAVMERMFWWCVWLEDCPEIQEYRLSIFETLVEQGWKWWYDLLYNKALYQYDKEIKRS